MAKTRKTIPYNERGREAIYTLIASLIGDTDCTKWVGQDLRLLNYPDEFAFEKVVIEAIYASNPPTEKNVARFLRENKGLEEGLDGLLKPIFEIKDEIKKQPKQETVQQAWQNFWGWWQGVVFAETLLRSYNLQISASDLTDEEKRRIIQKDLSQTLPTLKRTDTYYGFQDMGRAATERHQKILEYEENGGSAYPGFPISKLTKKLGGLADGDPLLFTSGSKLGKTTMFSVFGEYMAFAEGSYVLGIALETDVTAFWRRFCARHFGIPTAMWRTPLTIFHEGREIEIPKVNMKHPYWNELLDPDGERIRQYLEEQNIAKGVFVLERAVGWSVPSLKGLIMQHLRRAESMGKRFVVIMDYLQRSVWANLQDGTELELMVAYSNEWKDFAGIVGFPSIMFSQETDGGKHGETKAYGSRIPGTVFQVHASLKREPIEVEGKVIAERVVDPATQEQLYNALGQQRWYAQESGDRSGLKAVIRIEASNEGGRGDVPAWIEGSLYNLADPDKSLDPMWGVRKYDMLDLGRFVK